MVATVFWCWALRKVVTTADQDYGAVTFLPVIASCGSISSSVRTVGLCGVTRQQAWFACGSIALATLNFLYVLVTKYEVLPPSFAFYLGVGTSYWATAGAVLLSLTPNARDAHASLQHTEDSEGEAFP